jgi:hypothetical protein
MLACESVKRRELPGSGLVPVRLLAAQRQVLRSWPAGLVPGLRDAALDSSLWCRDEARLAASGGVAGRSRGRDG